MKDIKNYDYLSVSVKTDNEEEMIARYRTFGWEVTERFDDKRFFDLAVLNFRRQHEMQNKDRLQYLQVGMETVVNNLSKREQNKHALSWCLGLNLGIFGCGFLAVGISLMILITALWSVLVGVVMILIGVGLLVTMALVLKRLIPKEKQKYIDLSKEAQSELSRIDSEAAMLVKKV